MHCKLILFVKLRHWKPSRQSWTGTASHTSLYFPDLKRSTIGCQNCFERKQYEKGKYVSFTQGLLRECTSFEVCNCHRCFVGFIPYVGILSQCIGFCNQWYFLWEFWWFLRNIFQYWPDYQERWFTQFKFLVTFLWYWLKIWK